MSSSQDPQRLLIVRPDRVGDVIISSSCLPLIRERYPQSELYFAARPVMEPLFRQHPLIHGFIPLPTSGSWWKRFQTLTEAFSRLHLDTLVELHPDPLVSLSAYSARISRRIGYRYRGLTWTRTESVMDRRHEGTQHEARYNFDLLSLLDLQPPAVLSGSIHLPDGAFHSIAQRLAFPIHSTPFISLHLSAHSPIARWPASSFAALTRWIWTTWGYEVVLIGAERTDPSRAEYLECLGTDASKIHDLTGATSLAALGALLQNAKGLVTRDTGPCHLAAAVGCPVVEIFGRTSPLYGPTRWTALGARVVVVQNPISQNPGESRHQYWKRSFAAISVESVQCALHQLLQS